jgi:hypothetical protein
VQSGDEWVYRLFRVVTYIDSTVCENDKELDARVEDPRFLMTHTALQLDDLRDCILSAPSTSVDDPETTTVGVKIIQPILPPFKLWTF